MKIVYDEGPPSLILPDLGVVAERGVDIDVPDDIAGTEPVPPKGAPDEEGYDPGDPGSGLLAQSTVWRKAGALKGGRGGKS